MRALPCAERLARVSALGVDMPGMPSRPHARLEREAQSMSVSAADLDLGDDHSLRFASYKDDPRAGADVHHKKPDGTDCVGWISFAGGAWARDFQTPIATWEVVSWEPLTLTPSIACRTCGDHGHITEGKWVRA